MDLKLTFLNAVPSLIRNGLPRGQPQTDTTHDSDDIAGKEGTRIDIWLGKEKTPKPEKAAAETKEGTEEWAKVTISDPPLCLSVFGLLAASFKRRARAPNLCHGGRKEKRTDGGEEEGMTDRMGAAFEFREKDFPCEQ